MTEEIAVGKPSALRKLLLSMPLYWPVEMAFRTGTRPHKLPTDPIRFIREAIRISFPPPPTWVTPNRVLSDLDTMLLREFSTPDATDDDIPVIVDAPYAGHPTTIADYANGQSLVQTLIAAGCRRIYVTDWKSATKAMKDYGIDRYLSDLAVAVDSVGGSAHLVGLCQGGWLSAMLAARYPAKVRSLVLAGAPMDVHVAGGFIASIARHMPMAYFRGVICLGGGLLRGHLMLRGWKSMHPEVHYWGKYVDLLDNLDDPAYLQRARTFASWYEHTVDLPGRFYLEAVEHLFKNNELARGCFVAHGQTISLQNIRVPVYLLAGRDDDITLKDQVFAAQTLLGTPKDQVVCELAPGGHIGLFMGEETLRTHWVRIGQWIVQQGRSGPVSKQAH